MLVPSFFDLKGVTLMVKRVLSILLICCLIVGIIPTTALAATTKLTLDSSTTENVATWNDFAAQFSAAEAGDVVKIEVTESVELPTPLKNEKGASFYITGAKGVTVKPFIRTVEDEQKFKDTHLFTFKNGTTESVLDVKNVTLDGDNKTGLLYVSQYGFVCLGSNNDGTKSPVVFQNGSTAMMSVASVRLEEIHVARVWDCTFDGNKGNSNSPTTGCLYFSMNSKPLKYGGIDHTGLNVKGCTFNNNTAHSGGAMYVYGQHAYAYIDPTTTFTNNKATQRGGAIHCHGTVMVDSSSFSGNSSEGLGGTIYVSANKSATSTGEEKNNFGVVVLNGRPDEDGGTGLTISRSHAGTAGGAVYIAKDATVMLMGELHITDNTVGEGAEERDSNIYTAGTDAHIVCTKRFVECAHNGAVGISTSSPETKQDIILSPLNLTSKYGANVADEYPNYTLALRHLQEDSAENQFPKNAATYSIASEPSNVYAKIPGFFTYDGALLKVVHDTRAQHEGMLMLDYKESIPEGQSAIFFDYALPGEAAHVEVGAPGKEVSLPSVVRIKNQGKVTYKFLGWYTKAQGGDRQPDGSKLTIKKEIQTYYAHWDVSVDDKETATGDMKLVYFDQNIEGGGVTAAYITFGVFTFEVEFWWTDPTDPDAEPVKKIDTVRVDLPFGWPGYPHRTGYTFAGWSLSPTGTDVLPGSWRPTNPATTLYGVWIPDDCELVWDTVGGSGGGTFIVDYGTIIEPPQTPPTKPGYSFGGWYLGEEYEVPLAVGTKATGDYPDGKVAAH